MITTEEIIQSLTRFTSVKQYQDVIRVSTHCLYPSNGKVSVFIVGGNNSFMVKDEGGALKAIYPLAELPKNIDKRIFNIIRNYGLQVKNGNIYSRLVTKEQLPATILLVANASKEVADQFVGKFNSKLKRNFRDELAKLLDGQFHNRLHRDFQSIGQSNKLHKFAYAIDLFDERKLLINTVVNDPNSINACVVSTLDVKQANHSHLNQMIIYDEGENWRSESISLLQIGAPVVAYSHCREAIQKIERNQGLVNPF